jgi:hypothetical protein
MNRLMKIRRGRNLAQMMVMRDRAASFATATTTHTTGIVRLIRIETQTRNFKVVATTEMHTNKCHPVKKGQSDELTVPPGTGSRRPWCRHAPVTPLVSLLQNRITLNTWPLSFDLLNLAAVGPRMTY